MARAPKAGAKRGKKTLKKAPKKASKSAKKAPKKPEKSRKKAPKPAPAKARKRSAGPKPKPKPRPKSKVKAKVKPRKANKPTKRPVKRAYHPDVKERLRESLTRVCAMVEGGCNGIRVYRYPDGKVDAELRIGAPTKRNLRQRLLEIEEAMQSEVWPSNAWVSTGFMGHLDPSRSDGYAKKAGLEIVEVYPQRRSRMGVNFLAARQIADSLYLRQKVTEFVIRIHLGDSRPDRRYHK